MENIGYGILILVSSSINWAACPRIIFNQEVSDESKELESPTTADPIPPTASACSKWAHLDDTNKIISEIGHFEKEA